MTSLFLSYCTVKASSHREKVRVMIPTLMYSRRVGNFNPFMDDKQQDDMNKIWYWDILNPGKGLFIEKPRGQSRGRKLFNYKSWIPQDVFRCRCQPRSRSRFTQKIHMHLKSYITKPSSMKGEAISSESELSRQPWILLPIL